MFGRKRIRELEAQVEKLELDIGRLEGQLKGQKSKNDLLQDELNKAKDSLARSEYLNSYFKEGVRSSGSEWKELCAKYKDLMDSLEKILGEAKSKRSLLYMISTNDRIQDNPLVKEINGEIAKTNS